MALTLADKSFGKHHLDWRLTMTSHSLIPRDRQPARPTVLQAELIHTRLDKNRVARVSVLADDFTWTVLLDIPATAWPSDLDSSDQWRMDNAMDKFAEDLMRRAEAILDPTSAL